jgi:peptide/nickel transport system ATP-binding protein/oligopeptide transport system ATP-binding protein
MYAGSIVEEGDLETIFNHPQHPYTQGLLASVPNVDAMDEELQAIPGTLPGLEEQIEGCRFHPRCPFAMDICKQQVPKTYADSDHHKVKCWLKEEETNGRQDALSTS